MRRIIDGIGVEMTPETFDQIWSMASTISPQGLVSTTQDLYRTTKFFQFCVLTPFLCFVFVILCLCNSLFSLKSFRSVIVIFALFKLQYQAMPLYQI